MFECLDEARRLTGSQIKIIAAAIIGDMLEFFDYFLIGLVLAFIVKPWQLTFGQSAIILLSSGIGAILWPTHLRTTGMGSAYGFGGIGKMVGPLGLALIVGSSNVVKPDVTVSAIPASFLFVSAWLVLCGLAFLLFGFETRQRPITALDADYAAAAAPVPIRAATGARQ